MLMTAEPLSSRERPEQPCRDHLACRNGAPIGPSVLRLRTLRRTARTVASTMLIVIVAAIAEARTYSFPAGPGLAQISNPMAPPTPTPTPVPTTVSTPAPDAVPSLISMRGNHCSPLRSQIIAELGEIKRCNSTSDCVMGFIPNLPCTISICKIPYSKNVDLGKIKSLSLQFRNNGCERGCPTYACTDDVSVSVRCESNRCVEKFSR